MGVYNGQMHADGKGTLLSRTPFPAAPRPSPEMALHKTQSITSKGEDVEYVKNEVSRGDEDFGGPEERKRMEKKLLRKLDARMSILIVIYILNYVRLLSDVFSCGPVLNLDILDRP